MRTRTRVRFAESEVLSASSYRRALCYIGGMEVGNRFMAPAPDPGERLIQTHRESLATAMRNRLARGALPIRFECEAARCRIILNAARREVACEYSLVEGAICLHPNGRSWHEGLSAREISVRSSTS